MDHITQTETRRLALQAGLDAGKARSDRNQLGQFATPPTLAFDILTHAKSLLGRNALVHFLDPAIGTGAFFSALLSAFRPKRVHRAVGFELDAHYAKPTQRLWRDTKLKIHLADFTRMTPPSRESGRFNVVICNPPYVRHHHLAQAEKVRLRRAAEGACGIRIAGLAGLYCYFLGLSHAWLAKNGIAGWLIPSEFMDVNYGLAVKRYLLDKVTLLRIHRFDPNEVQFGDALVSSAVVWFRNAKPPAGHRVEFTFGGTLAAPSASKLISVDVLKAEPKWSRFPTNGVRIGHHGPRLCDFFEIKRGLVTGGNHFFIMTREEIANHNLPMEFFRPILPSPRYLHSDEIKSDSEGLPIIQPQLFLLDCRLPERTVKARYPSLWAYLNTGRPEISERYLCKSRMPWYSQETRPTPLFLCTYMGRGNTRRGRPFRFILNHSRATAANVYLLLYPKEELTRALSVDPGLARKIWKVLQHISPAEMLDEGRVYGGGLYKLEPKELANVHAEGIATLVPEAVIPSVRQFDLFPAKVA